MHGIYGEHADTDLEHVSRRASSTLDLIDVDLLCTQRISLRQKHTWLRREAWFAQHEKDLENAERTGMKAYYFQFGHIPGSAE